MSKATIIRAVSLDIEHETGYDSVDTIERFQLCDDSFLRNTCEIPCHRYHCIYPRCTYRSAYPHVLWIHEMFGHGLNHYFLGWNRRQFLKEFCGD